MKQRSVPTFLAIEASAPLKHVLVSMLQTAPVTCSASLATSAQMMAPASSMPVTPGWSIALAASATKAPVSVSTQLHVPRRTIALMATTAPLAHVFLRLRPVLHVLETRHVITTATPPLPARKMQWDVTPHSTVSMTAFAEMATARHLPHVWPMLLSRTTMRAQPQTGLRPPRSLVLFLQPFVQVTKTSSPTTSLKTLTSRGHFLSAPRFTPKISALANSLSKFSTQMELQWPMELRFEASCS